MQDSSKISQEVAFKEPQLSKRFKAFLEKNNGSFRFYDFMKYSLYDELEGYYTSPSKLRVGKQGDFITSVSVGSTYAKLIIQTVKKILRSRNEHRFTFVEFGSEGGTFAQDFLDHWNQEDGKLLSYFSIDPSTAKRERLTDHFKGHSLFQALKELPKQGEFTIIFANEVLDSFPVHLIENTSEGWMEVGLKSCGDTMKECFLPISSSQLLEKLSALPSDLPIGYRTEICLDYSTFFSNISKNTERCHGLFIDYYLAEEDYYAEHRVTGTLQTYSQHSKNASPYDEPGKVDLSCHVNYSLVKEAAIKAGFSISKPESQGSFLTTNSKDWLLSLKMDSPQYQKTINEFKTLTMPQFFGTKFQVVEILK